MIHQGSWEDQKTIRGIVLLTNALLDGASGVFERGGGKRPEIDEMQVKVLHAKIGDRAIGTPLVRETMARRWPTLFWNES
jgi:hypothetical protein